MKIILSLFAVSLLVLSFLGCEGQPGANARSVYMLLDPSNQVLKQKHRLEETFAYVINDLSPGDSLVIHTSEEVINVEFSKSASMAYVQKRNLRRKMCDYIKNLQPKIGAKILPTIAKAKAYLDTKIALHKSIIYCNPSKHIDLDTDNLEGYTISMLNFTNTNEDLSHVKSKIEIAKGRFLVASNINELGAALAYK